MSKPAGVSSENYLCHAERASLSFRLDWPFRPASSGATSTFSTLEITLENSGGLRALVAVNLSVTLREVLPSLDAKDAEAPVITLYARMWTATD